MITSSFFNTLIYIWIGFGIILFPILLIIKAPYGRHTSNKWGPMISNRFGWIIMELPALVVFAGFYIFGSNKHNFVTWLFFILWAIHYTNRIFLFPLRIKTRHKKMPIIIMFFAIFFNTINGFFNGYFFGSLSQSYSISWLTDIRFILGLILFLSGFAINQWSDNKLIQLRSNSTNGYYIPKGGLFKFISCPNYFGEIIEWAGFAIMTWCLPALSFALWTAFNLIPRALDHHKWYGDYFDDYPAKRKAVFPYIL